ncbi:calcium-binding protein [Streptomyces sp. NPDC059063]|uniref:calcium-binding protein n=1 Tax=unclassified Streptomyces TaxID=2593676 RepID=UPI0036A4FEA8
MRIRATVAAVSGALALSALVLPAAQAAEGPDVPQFAPRAAAAPDPGKDAQKGDIKITNVVVNGGKSIVVGTTAKKKFTAAVTLTDPSGIKEGGAFLWHGTKLAEGYVDGVLTPADNAVPTCKKLNATTSACSMPITVNPKAGPDKNGLRNHLAGGGWNVYGGGEAKDGDYVVKHKLKTAVRFQRAARLTVNASPEPVRKGKAITVAGALTRANWDTHKYAGYTRQPVKLEFKKKGASAWSTVKTVTSDGKGNLRTTVKASADGTFRYVFAGTSTTPAVTSAGDFVDVR